MAPHHHEPGPGQSCLSTLAEAAACVGRGKAGSFCFPEGDPIKPNQFPACSQSPLSPLMMALKGPFTPKPVCDSTVLSARRGRELGWSASFKARLDGALSNLVWWKMSLLMAGGLEPDDLYGPFQPKPFCDSKKENGESVLLPSATYGQVAEKRGARGCGDVGGWRVHLEFRGTH